MEGGFNFSTLAPSVFDGDNYQMWAVRMETYLEALDLWEVVEEEIQSLPEKPTVPQIKSQKEKKMKRSKAKACLFATVSPMVFTRIMSLKSAKKYGITSRQNMKVMRGFVECKC